VKAVDAAISAVTRGWKKQALADALGAVGVPAGPVNSIAEAFDNPQVKHRNIAVQVDHPGLGPIGMVHSPFRFSETPVRHRPAPELGAQTDDVLREVLGLDAQAIAALRSAKVC
jgi:crotonobetainyl-CoA:carnitine CoA-transferase CaiB-like acyl-CoA transferase